MLIAAFRELTITSNWSGRLIAGQAPRRGISSICLACVSGSGAKMNRSPSLRSLDSKQHSSASKQCSGLLATVGPMRTVAHRSQQLCRRLNAGVAAAGRHSLRMLSSAWAAPHVTAGADASGVLQRTASGDEQLVLDLDWQAELTVPQEVICWHTAAAVCCVAYALTAPTAISIPYGTCMGLLFGLLLMFMRSSMLEVLYKVSG